MDIMITRLVKINTIIMERLIVSTIEITEIYFYFWDKNNRLETFIGFYLKKKNYKFIKTDYYHVLF